MLGLISALLVLVTIALPAGAMAPVDVDLTARLDAACQEADGIDCGVTATRRNDHVYLFPAVASSADWSSVCLSAPHHDRARVSGVPIQYRELLHDVSSLALAGWVAAGGPLSDPQIQTVTFCGMRFENVFLLDWSATEARIRFDIVAFEPASRPPQGIVASRGVFSGGLSISRSDFAAEISVEDAHFGAFVAIELNRMKQSFVVKNTRVDGALRLRDNEFQDALRLEALVIAGDAIFKNNSFSDVRGSPPFEPDGTTFSVVRLRELRLGGVLEFVDNDFQIAAVGRSARSLYLQKSTISDNDVTIRRNAFAGRVYLVEVEGKRVTISQNSFVEYFEMSASDVYSFRSFDNHYLGSFGVVNNRIAGSLIIDRDVFDRSDTVLLDVRNNRIGHDLRFAPKSWPAQGYTVDFSFNDVVGPFSFFWPLMNENGRGVVHCSAWRDPDAGRIPRWRGDINFVGLRVRTSMHLVEACSVDPLQAVLPYPDIGARQSLESPLSPAHTVVDQPATTIDLSLVETGVLRIDLPASGLYNWRGKGLDFQFFGTTNQGQVARVNGRALLGTPERTSNDHLVAWLHNLQQADPEIYFAASDYFRGRGEIDNSRHWLARGRDVDFGPTGCVGLYECARGWAIKIILAPSNFGTQPEWVLICLAVLWASMTVVYTAYRRGWLGHAAIAPMPDGDQTVAAAGLPPRYGSGVEEAPSPSGWQGSSGRPDALRRQEAYYDDDHGGYRTKVPGFVAHRPEDANRAFSLWAYSLDATLPVISLDRFRAFTPTSRTIRALSIVHHILGWWLVTLFFGASFF